MFLNGTSGFFVCREKNFGEPGFLGFVLPANQIYKQTFNFNIQCPFQIGVGDSAFFDITFFNMIHDWKFVSQNGCREIYNKNHVSCLAKQD